MFTNLDPKVAAQFVTQLDRFRVRVRQSLSPVSLGFAQGLLIGRAMQLCEQGACAEEHVLELSALTTDDVLARLVELGIAPPPEVSPTPNRLH